MSEQITKSELSIAEEYEKSKKFFGDEEYSPEEFAALSRLYNESFPNQKVPFPKTSSPI
jgi:hypothetical protein